MSFFAELVSYTRWQKPGKIQVGLTGFESATHGLGIGCTSFVDVH